MDGYVIQTNVTNPLQVFAGASRENVLSFLSTYSYGKNMFLEPLVPTLLTTPGNLTGG